PRRDVVLRFHFLRRIIVRMELRDQDVSLRMLIRVLPLLEKLHSCGTGRDTAGNRTLFFDDYAKLTLVYLFNPLIDSISMLQRAAALPKRRWAHAARRCSDVVIQTVVIQTDCVPNVSNL
ncbi:MAG TPA: hypothetical protein VFW23_04235, partial [Tepidisphaeraceae bacterium]|nr:hypothetical protein [Tepidisphaeraceae bacterium]